MQKSTLVRNCTGVFVALQQVGCLKMQKIYVVQWIPACAGMTNTCHPRPDRGAMPSSMVNTRLCGYDKEHRWYAQDKAGMTKSKVRLGNIRTTHLLA